MLAKAHSGALIGVEAIPVDIEVNTGEQGEPRTFIVGLPDAAVKESLNRVSSALSNSGFIMPLTKTTINLAPGDIRKEGPIYDLPIALAILAAMDKLSAPEKLSEFVIAGELSLSGGLRGICGGVSLAILARNSGKKKLILPEDSAAEAALVEGVESYSARTLRDIVNYFNGDGELKRVTQSDSPFMSTPDPSKIPDFSEVRGQESVKRAIEVAVAGGHNLLMIGPPGSGKSMMAKRIPSIMPPPSIDEYLEILGIYSAAGLSQSPECKMFYRPFRAPHHTISDIGLTGGGSNPKPGEISLAHNGVLFLDELPEFKRSALEVLRQPLEDATVTISRSAAKITIPCRFMLVAAMNPCPCGYFGDRRGKCKCTPLQIQRYKSKISGPLLDRIDIHVEASAIPISDMASPSLKSESSAEMRKRIEAAYEIQQSRFSNSPSIYRFNARMSPAQIKEFCPLTKELSDTLSMAMEELNLSARAWNKIIKVSRTIADLDASREIKLHHLLEAINYRSLDRQ